MRPAQQRKAQRAAHLLAAFVLITYAYAPVDAELRDTVRFIVLPVLVLTGVAMWQAARIRRIRRAPSKARST
jgi:hypothetical protein